MKPTIKITLTEECIKQLKKDGHELVRCADGTTIEFAWSSESNSKIQAENKTVRGKGPFCEVIV